MAHVVQGIHDDTYGETHGTYDTEYSLCGIKLDTRWHVLGTTIEYNITCKECKRKREKHLQKIAGDK